MKNIIFIIFFISCSFASEIIVDSKVNKSRITIGDLIEYTITIVYQKNLKVELPTKGVNLGNFDIRDYETIGPKNVDKNRISTTIKYIITTYEVGEYEISKVEIKYNNKQIFTEPIKIIVESVKSQDAKDIKDIKKPVLIPFSFLGYFIFAGIIIIIIILAIITIKYLKKRKLQQKEEIILSRSPEEIAYELLAQIEKENLLLKGKIKEYYIKISEAIRKYIEKRYEIMAIEETTEEIFRKMQEANINKDNIIFINLFLSDCDLVKFAKYRPTEQENQNILPRAYEIIKKTQVKIQVNEEK